LSVEAEKRYILGKSQRIRHTIEYFNYILQDKKFEKRKCKILDIGTSPFTFLFNKCLEAEISTIDLTDLYSRRCRSDNIRFKKCNILEEDIPFPDNEFDIIIFTEVFEHLISPPKPIFQRINKVLNDGGTLVFSTPNLNSPYNILMLMLGKRILPRSYELFNEDADGDCVHGCGHWRKFTMEELIDILRRYGFKIIKYRHIIKPYISIRTSNPLRFIRRLGLKALMSIFPAAQFNLILAQKK
jgi:2-polyprenyl-3-methyl-5-hydroxy-6-metoxy-1,4-benzoquinol methylase